MNVHKNARMTRFGRLQLVHRIRQEGWTVAQAAEASSVSVRTAYKWLARYRAGGEPALCDRSSAPGHCPHRLAGETVAEIERLRRTRWTGPRISRATGVPLSTVGLVLRRLGLGRLRALDPRPPVIRYERKHPGRDHPHRHQEARPHQRPRPPHDRSPPRAQARQRLGISARRHRRCLAARLHRSPGQ